MVKINKPKGLIRYASYNSIKDGVQKLINPRLIGYTIVMIGLLSLLSFLIFTRSEVETTVLKVRGTLYQKTDDGYITNLYNIEFVNKTFDEIEVTLKVESPNTAVLSRVGNQAEVIPAEEMLKGVYFIKIKPEDLTSARTDVVLGVYRDGKKIETVSTKFLGPISIKK
jgi:polyferredoxin